MGEDYHAEIGYPDVEYATGSYEVSPTTHAEREASNDEYGGFNLPIRIKLTENMYERDPKAAVGEVSEEPDEPLQRRGDLVTDEQTEQLALYERN